MVPTIWKPDHSKCGQFCPDLKWFLTKGGHLSGFQMAGLPIPFEILTIFVTIQKSDFWGFQIQLFL